MPALPPYCPILERLVDQFPGKVRLVFKFYPLAGHAHGASSARAAVAAMRQGKFWEMYHALFEHQTALEPTDLEKYAKDIGIDVARFRTDLQAESTGVRTERDHKQGDQLAITGTPTIYINGREYDLKKFDLSEDLSEWVRLEIELLDKQASTATGVSGAAGPAAPGPDARASEAHSDPRDER